MKTLISVSLARMDNELFCQLSAGNSNGTKISLRVPAEQLFEKEVQALINSVFGPALACLLRGEARYRELERKYEESNMELLEQDDDKLAAWYADALETF